MPVCFALFLPQFLDIGWGGAGFISRIFSLSGGAWQRLWSRTVVRLAQIARERECGRMEWAVLDGTNRRSNFIDWGPA